MATRTRCSGECLPLRSGPLRRPRSSLPLGRLHSHSISPTIPPDQVLVRTLAAPINPADINTIRGSYGIKQPFTSLLGTPEPSAVPGNEGVFEVMSVGSNVSHLCRGDWVLPAVPQIGTWRSHALLSPDHLFKIDKTGLKPIHAAIVSVNPCTAYRILTNYGPTAGVKPGLAMQPMRQGSRQWFIQNGANSAVGRSAIQLGKLWGLRSISVVRERSIPEATRLLVQDLYDLGATSVVLESDFTSIKWRHMLKEIVGQDEIKLGLNCVGGDSATTVARSLGHGGTMVTYGNMGRRPMMLSTSDFIFKDIRLVGFWLTRWNEADPAGRKRMIDFILDLTRQGRFRYGLTERVPWYWESEEVAMKHIPEFTTSGRVEGHKDGKGVFIFQDTPLSAPQEDNGQP